MSVIRLRSPAKLNLFLQVLAKRPDGFHELKTLFERISLSDELTFRSRADGKIRIACDHPQVPKGKKNLVMKAACALREVHGVTTGADISIRKNIPVAAGLAGGSSNGATALRGLNTLWRLGLSQRQLLKHARALGSDIPFFLYDTSFALGTGRGDVITPLKWGVKFWHILVIPRVKMYSAEVFTTLNLQLTKKGDNANILIRLLRSNNINKAGRLLFNDLEAPILAIRPQLQNVKNAVKADLKEGVCFSGSGPSVFGITCSKTEALELQNKLSRRYTRVYAVSTL